MSVWPVTAVIESLFLLKLRRRHSARSRERLKQRDQEKPMSVEDSIIVTITTSMLRSVINLADTKKV